MRSDGLDGDCEAPGMTHRQHNGESCATCRFYYTGTCRRHPPTVAWYDYNDEPRDLCDTDRRGHVTRWPEPEANDWCGEYEAEGPKA